MASLEIAGDEIVSASDVLQKLRDTQVNAQAQAARAKQSASCCTYSKGYLAQGVFACRTCTPESAGIQAGFCLGCSLTCHLNHDVLELFIKRSFRCDCGNSKFKDCPQSTCSLEPCKDEVNVDNRYNQNFFGLYCKCSKPYDPARDTMLQCIRCQDWFHDKCIVGMREADSSLDLFCSDCVSEVPFLHVYMSRLIRDPESESWTFKQGDDVPKDSTSGSTECVRPVATDNDVPVEGPVFLPDEFNTCLCQCSSCLDQMKAQNVLYLVHDDEVVEEHERLFGEPSDEEFLSVEIAPDFDSDALLNRAVGRLDRGAAIDGIVKMQGFFENFKTGFGELLQKNPDHVITKEDVDSIVERMASGQVLGKRQRS